MRSPDGKTYQREFSTVCLRIEFRVPGVLKVDRTAPGRLHHKTGENGKQRLAQRIGGLVRHDWRK